MMTLFSEEQIMQAVRHEQREEGRAEGRAEGEAKGRAEERTDLAKKMLQESLSTDMVARISGLSLSEVNALRSQVAPPARA